MSEFPNIEQLREARAWWDDAPEDATYIPEYIPEYDDAVSDAIDFLLSLADSGGRLVAEQPCEHGDDWFTCDAEDCPGGFRTRVWPTDKEEE